MEELLKNMDESKRSKIINSIIDEFTKYPYNKASTNNIVKNAGISKGLLFHYFGNKQEMYDRTCTFVLNTLFDRINDNINWDETDVFQRIKQIVLIKMEISKVYPQMFNFVMSMIKNQPKQMTVEDIVAMYKKYGVSIGDILGKVYSYNLDFSRFKDPTRIKEYINIIRWTMEKYSEEMMQNLPQGSNPITQQVSDELDVYVNVLKKAFYNKD